MEGGRGCQGLEEMFELCLSDPAALRGSGRRGRGCSAGRRSRKSLIIPPSAAAGTNGDTRQNCSRLLPSPLVLYGLDVYGALQ